MEGCFVEHARVHHVFELLDSTWDEATVARLNLLKELRLLRRLHCQQDEQLHNHTSTGKTTSQLQVNKMNNFKTIGQEKLTITDSLLLRLRTSQAQLNKINNFTTTGSPLLSRR